MSNPSNQKINLKSINQKKKKKRQGASDGSSKWATESFWVGKRREAGPPPPARHGRLAGVFVTASPHPHEAPADAASEPAALARCSWFTPRCVSPARGCPGLPISTMGRGWALGPPREGAHFCGLWNLVLLLQGPLSLASTEAKSCPSCDLSFPTTGTCRGLLGGRRGAGSPLAVSPGGRGPARCCHRPGPQVCPECRSWPSPMRPEVSQAAPVQRGKPRLREGEGLALSHPARKRQSRDPKAAI